MYEQHWALSVEEHQTQQHIQQVIFTRYLSKDTSFTAMPLHFLRTFSVLRVCPFEYWKVGLDWSQNKGKPHNLLVAGACVSLGILHPPQCTRRLTSPSQPHAPSHGQPPNDSTTCTWLTGTITRLDDPSPPPHTHIAPAERAGKTLRTEKKIGFLTPRNADPAGEVQVPHVCMSVRIGTKLVCTGSPLRWFPLTRNTRSKPSPVRVPRVDLQGEGVPRTSWFTSD